MVFHARLGSVGDKVRRLEKLAPEIAEFVPDADADSAARAARLCKADLVTGMVREFPALQGVMGRYYARHDGEAAPVADAIADHYAPAGAGESCPRAPVSVALALADRLDTLAGFFMIDERPTGSKDPFALRRAALGVVRLVLDNALDVLLRTPLARAARGHGADDPEAVAESVAGFVAERHRALLREQGRRHDVARAVFAKVRNYHPLGFQRRVLALGAFLETPDGSDLMTALRRAGNILRIEEKNDGKDYKGGVDARLFAAPAEAALVAKFEDAGPTVRSALAGGRFEDAMRGLAAFREPLDRFFAEVKVNAEDPRLRENRLRILGSIYDALSGVADFSLIEGS